MGTNEEVGLSDQCPACGYSAYDEFHGPHMARPVVVVVEEMGRAFRALGRALLRVGCS